MIYDMKVASIDYAYGFANGSPNDDDPHHENSDWSKIQDICCFTTTDDSCCEFIVHLKAVVDSPDLSEDFNRECRDALEAGFDYACFYA